MWKKVLAQMNRLKEVFEAHFFCTPEASNKDSTVTWRWFACSYDTFAAWKFKSKFDWVDEWWRSLGRIAALKPCEFDEIAYSR